MMRIFITISVLLILGLVSCTKDNFIDTGVCEGRHEGESLLEYMENDSYNWDSCAVMVRHAGEDMVRLFEGKDPDHPEITFFGTTNHSIRRYLLANRLKQVADLDPAWCRSILLRHIVDGKLYRKDIPAGVQGSYGTAGAGGTTLTTLGGTRVWIYVNIQETNGIVLNASKPIYINFLAGRGEFAIASGGIEPDNCIVHALAYNFTLGDE